MKQLLVSLVLLAIYFSFNVKSVLADTISLTASSCDVDDVANVCLTQLQSDGGSSYALAKGSHIDGALQTLSASAITSATLYFDSWGSLTGDWSIYLKDARDGTTICSSSPAPEDSSETRNSVSCTLTTSQLSTGVWVQINNNDNKGPEDINLDYIYLYVDYTPPPAVSISLSSDGVVSFGTVMDTSVVDTTALGINDAETILIDSGPANLDVKSSIFSDGSNTWSLGSSSGADQVLWEFSPDGSSWSTFVLVDTLYSLATNITQSNSQDLFLRLTTPTSTSSYNQHSAAITIVASSP